MAGGGDPKWQKDAADQNFDYMFKLLIIGNSSVGKTSFLFRYADDSFTSAFVSTVGIDFKVKTVFRHDKRVKLQIWVSWFEHYTPSPISGTPCTHYQTHHYDLQVGHVDIMKLSVVDFFWYLDLTQTCFELRAFLSFTSLYYFICITSMAIAVINYIRMIILLRLTMSLFVQGCFYH